MANAADREHPVPVYQSHRALSIARNLKPITEIQSEFSKLDAFQPINCHAHVHDADNTKESKYAWLLLLNVTTQSINVKPFYVDGNKKRKTEPKPREYRRLFTFANLASPGSTCVMMEMTLYDQMHIFNYVIKCRIGDQFVAIEPSSKVSFIGVDMPILETKGPLIPVRLRRNMLPVEVPVPHNVSELNSSRFFVLHNAKIQFDGVDLIKTGCTMGNMCDLRHPTRKQCSCLQQNSRNRTDAEYTLSGDIAISYLMRNRDDHHSSTLPKVREWSSQHFTNFVFDGSIPINPLHNESNREIITMLRRYLRNLVAYVNSSDQHTERKRGWTVVGWYRRGAKNDAATPGSDDKVAADMEEATMHIIRIQPTTITKSDLREAKRLIPVTFLGETADIETISTENREAVNVARVPTFPNDDEGNESMNNDDENEDE